MARFFFFQPICRERIAGCRHPRKNCWFASENIRRAEAAGIRLRNGEVSCISCHNLLKKDRFHLVIENYRIRLCMSCQHPLRRCSACLAGDSWRVPDLDQQKRCARLFTK